MTKTKKVILISALTFALATLGAIIAAPFAIKSCIAEYNLLVDEASAQKGAYVKQVTLAPEVKTLKLTLNDWMRVNVLPSKTGQIYLELYDSGFSYTVAEEPVVSKDGTAAAIVLDRGNSYKITEENIKKALFSELNNESSFFVNLYVTPETVLEAGESEDEYDWYSDCIILGNTMFANREDLAARLSRPVEVAQIDFSDEYAAIAQAQSGIVELKASLTNESMDLNVFQTQAQHLYQEIATTRRDILQEVFEVRHRSSPLPEHYQLTEELCSAERKCDQAEMALNTLYNDYKNGRITQDVYLTLKEEQEASLKELQTLAEEKESQWLNLISEAQSETFDPAAPQEVIEPQSTPPLTEVE